jgi:hypothetical protein
VAHGERGGCRIGLGHVERDGFAGTMRDERGEQRFGDTRVVGEQRADLAAFAATTQHAISAQMSIGDVRQRDGVALIDPRAQKAVARRAEEPTVIRAQLIEWQFARIG